MATETIKFKIELYSTHWDLKPTCEVSINNNVKFSGEIDGTEQKPILIEFEHECTEGEKYELILNRQGKNNSQTILNSKGDITHDQLLHIKTIEIDEIDIGGLVYEGVYKPKYPEPWFSDQKKQGHEHPESFKNVTQMGHNGTWTLAFESPFYMWLLENLY